MANLSHRFPKVNSIIPVFAVLAFPIYAWTIVVWFWKLPSWLLFLAPLEIMGIFSYSMLTALVESVLACGMILLVSAVLPPKLFRDVFPVRGVWMAIGLTLCFLGNGGWRVVRVMSGYKLAFISLSTWSLVSIFVIFLLVFLSTRLRFMALFAAWFSERLVVFLYIQIPVSILCVVVVLVRNIF